MGKKITKKRVHQNESLIGELIELRTEVCKLPRLSPIEKELHEAEVRFEATYHSNKLEGNKLSEDEARSAIMI
ncbi:MAG: hypothetical protein ABSC29_03775 [Minisyncoccia bacterium]|jgi:hypothetical protein